MTSNANKLKFTVFADSHYKRNMYATLVSDIEQVVDRADANGSDFIIHAGDFCNDYIGSPELLPVYLNNHYGLSVYGVYGNHELEDKNNSMEFVTERLTNAPVVWGTADGGFDAQIGYYRFDCNGYRIICTDTNYSYNPDLKLYEHNKTTSYGAPDGNLYENSLGPLQLQWLENVLMHSAENKISCIVVSHAALHSDFDSCSPDSSKVSEIFKKVNSLYSKTVIMQISGHSHFDRIEAIDKIVYFSVNSTINGCWLPYETTHYDSTHTFPRVYYDENGNPTDVKPQLLDSLAMGKNTYFFAQPLSADVTVTENSLTVSGYKTEWLYGIEPPPEVDTTYIRPMISDFKYNLK